MSYQFSSVNGAVSILFEYEDILRGVQDRNYVIELRKQAHYAVIFLKQNRDEAISKLRNLLQETDNRKRYVAAKTLKQLNASNKEIWLPILEDEDRFVSEIAKSVLRQSPSDILLELKDKYLTVIPKIFCQFDWVDVRDSQKRFANKRINLQNNLYAQWYCEARCCPVCQKLARDLTWTYFSSSTQSWENFGYRAGWLTICEDCNAQVDFFCEIVS